jgi:hypothetical protein
LIEYEVVTKPEPEKKFQIVEIGEVFSSEAPPLKVIVREVII